MKCRTLTANVSICSDTKVCRSRGVSVVRSLTKKMWCTRFPVPSNHRSSCCESCAVKNPPRAFVPLRKCVLQVKNMRNLSNWVFHRFQQCSWGGYSSAGVRAEGPPQQLRSSTSGGTTSVLTPTKIVPSAKWRKSPTWGPTPSVGPRTRLTSPGPRAAAGTSGPENHSKIVFGWYALECHRDHRSGVMWLSCDRTQLVVVLLYLFISCSNHEWESFPPIIFVRETMNDFEQAAF